MKEYKQLCAIFAKYYNLSRISSILSWDYQTMMPKDGYIVREKQLKLIYELTDQTLNNSTVNKLIADLDPNELNEHEQRNLYLMEHKIAQLNAIPTKLKKNYDALCLKTEFIWAEAKQKNDYPLFDKYFSKLIKELREICQLKAEKFGISPYETLLEQYDPGRSEAQLNIVFAKLAKFLPDFIETVIAKQAAARLPNIKIDAATQKNTYLKILKKLGIKDNWCRIDTSNHPFCTGYLGDVRITTRYSETDYLSSLMGLIHEAGHATYDNNLPKKYLEQPIGQDAGIALHESQSLFFEMQLARSHEFCEFISPILNKDFSLNLTSTQLYQIINFVQKSYIRVDADELTYPLHIIMRYEIEQDLINQKIETKDIPEIWQQKVKEYFHLKAPDPQNGCLQDIHWSDGSLGYFPTYSLGAIYASQLKAALATNLPNYKTEIAAGNFTNIIKFLKTNIQQYGHSKSADQLLKNLTGKDLDVDCYIAYLEQKFF